MRAIRGVMSTGAVMERGFRRGDAVTVIAEGEVIPASHPIVRADPGAFVPVE